MLLSPSDLRRKAPTWLPLTCPRFGAPAALDGCVAHAVAHTADRWWHARCLRARQAEAPLAQVASSVNGTPLALDITSQGAGDALAECLSSLYVVCCVQLVQLLQVGVSRLRLCTAPAARTQLCTTLESHATGLSDE